MSKFSFKYKAVGGSMPANLETFQGWVSQHAEELESLHIKDVLDRIKNAGQVFNIIVIATLEDGDEILIKYF